jgi:hypothetical protein
MRWKAVPTLVPCFGLIDRFLSPLVILVGKDAMRFCFPAPEHTGGL